MTVQRDRMLERIAAAIKKARLPEGTSEHAQPPSVTTARANEEDRHGAHADQRDLAEGFARELAAVGGHVYRPAAMEEVAVIVGRILRAKGATRVIAWDEEWLGWPGAYRSLGAMGIEIAHCDVGSDSQQRKPKLKSVESAAAGITGAAAALADSGTLVIASGPGRGRLASLLPPVHVAIVAPRTLYPSLPAFLAAHGDIVESCSNVVLVTGPSRTADIEMTLSLGVHGPKEVHAILLPDA
jgi:L-lactate dehydrogenase complex protein LldG